MHLVERALLPPKNHMPTGFDVIVVGAGASGLAAAAELGASGLSVTILEARTRIGGRMFTEQDPSCHVPIELGAEFIHGRPPEIWRLLRKRKVSTVEVDGDNWCAGDGRLSKCDFSSRVDKILEQMTDRSPDESFLSFLRHCCPDSKRTLEQEEAKRRALDYISGFNAADPDLVSVHWLVKSMRAEEKIEGHRAFRFSNGYHDLVDIFLQRCTAARVSLQTDTVVEQISWRPGHAELTVKRPAGSSSIAAPRVLLTLPLAVLQAAPKEYGAVHFHPALPAEKLDSLKKLEMGKVIRIVLRFRHRFWDNIATANKSKTLSDMSFLFSEDEWFPTWWTSMPQKSPIITGWAPFRCAERLSAQSREWVIAKSLRTLGRLLKVEASELEHLLEAAYFHDWQNDPFSRGAYSYAKVGSDGAQEVLGRPVENTLFFAGEATDISGHNGTVHGAIASGVRAAAEVLRSLHSKAVKRA